jgi:hypothetical protein
MAEDEEVYGGEMAEEQLEMDELHEESTGVEEEPPADDVRLFALGCKHITFPRYRSVATNRNLDISFFQLEAMKAKLAQMEEEAAKLKAIQV